MITTRGWSILKLLKDYEVLQFSSFLYIIKAFFSHQLSWDWMSKLEGLGNGHLFQQINFIYIVINLLQNLK